MSKKQAKKDGELIPKLTQQQLQVGVDDLYIGWQGMLTSRGTFTALITHYLESPARMLVIPAFAAKLAGEDKGKEKLAVFRTLLQRTSDLMGNKLTVRKDKDAKGQYMLAIPTPKKKGAKLPSPSKEGTKAQAASETLTWENVISAAVELLKGRTAGEKADLIARLNDALEDA